MLPASNEVAPSDATTTPPSNCDAALLREFNYNGVRISDPAQQVFNDQRKALLAAAHISIWSAVKLDRKISRNVANHHGAHQSAGQYKKQMLRRADKLDEWIFIKALQFVPLFFHCPEDLAWGRFAG